jgi:DNA end-binding protein Ku
MPPRATWTGFLKLSLVTVPVRLYNAISSSSKIHLNQLHINCNQRIRQQPVCPVHGEINRDEIIKGYQSQKDKYVVIDEADLEKIKLETTKTIEIVQFVDPQEPDPIYFDSPYYVAPDGPIAEEAFRVIREAMRQTKKVAIGRVVMAGKETIVSLQVQEKGLRLTTMRYASEIRGSAPYFEDIQNGEVSKDYLALAKQIVETHTKPFDPAEFTDRYQEALLQLIKAKTEGKEPVVVQQAERGKVINLMDALRKSVVHAVPVGSSREEARGRKHEDVGAQGKEGKERVSPWLERKPPTNNSPSRAISPLYPIESVPCSPN